MAATASQPLDPEVVASLVDLGDEDGQSILKILADIFIDEECPACLKRIGDALQAGDHEELAEAAHKLKGGAGQLGALPLRELCAELEEKSRKADASVAAELLQRITAETQRVCAALQSEVAALGH